MIRCLLALLSAVGLAACFGADSPTGSASVEVQVDTIVLAPSPLVAHVDDYVFLTAFAYDKSGKRIQSPDIHWIIEDPALAHVSNLLQDTLVSVWGSALGTTTLTASFGGKTTTLPVDVRPPAIARLIVAPLIAAVENGTGRQLQLVALNVHNVPIAKPTAFWTSSDSTVASVDQTGNVTAHRVGSVEIRATLDTMRAAALVHVPTPFAMVAVGQGHTCALKEDGRTYCWGENGSGQLGDATALSRLAAVEVQTTARFTSIHVTASGTCGLTAAGEVYCWGSNRDGRLGLPRSDAVLVPTLVPTPEPFSQLSTGTSHICGIGASGKTYCWGLGSATGSANDPVPTPTEVVAPVPFVGLAAGFEYTCAVGTDGRAYCWGIDYMGELGDSVPDHTHSRGRYTIAPVAGNHQFKSISAGPDANSTCAVDLSGVQWCWGSFVEDDRATTTVQCLNDNLWGHIRCTPLPIPLTSPVELGSISIGRLMLCGLDVNGAAYCGNVVNSSASSSHLTKVDANVQFRQLSSGVTTECAISDTRMVYCWGSGVLGDYLGVGLPAVPFGVPSPYQTLPANVPRIIASP